MPRKKIGKKTEKLYEQYRKYYALGCMKFLKDKVTGDPEVDLGIPVVREYFQRFLARRCLKCESYLRRFAPLVGMSFEELYILRREYGRGRSGDLPAELRRIFSLLSCLTSKDAKISGEAQRSLERMLRKLRRAKSYSDA